MKKRFPKKQGLYDPNFEHDSCGVGFVCDINGKATSSTVKKSLQVLKRLSHRGAVGADPNTGDGAGILIQIPHDFFKKVCDADEIKLPEYGFYGTGQIFLPTNREERKFCKNVFQKVSYEEGQALLGWRKVKLDNSEIGREARKNEPVIEQVFITRDKNVKEQIDFERKLYVIRKKIENIIRNSNLKQKEYFYITNISSRTYSYKGLLMPRQLENFFAELHDNDIKTAIAVVHSRYSTNTFPTWDLAQPFRFLAHNGEINTLRGNINWMKAREGSLKSEVFGKDINKIKPVIVLGGSDSAALDNVFELLVLSGRSLELSMMMLIPEAWENNKLMNKKMKDFYKYHSCTMEPWDGPASVAFTDGKSVGAILDRNGLRPSRYIVTKDNLVVMASEAGVLDIPPTEVIKSGRLEPGKMFFINTEESRIVSDEEIKENIYSQKPYGDWVKKFMIHLDNVEICTERKDQPTKENFLTFLKVFGYTREDLKMIIKPMAEGGEEPTGSMGNDIPHAVLSKNPQLLYDYFKQLFAQVTNPAIDPIREEVIMSLKSYIGQQKNLLEEIPEQSHKLELDHPILRNGELLKIKHIAERSFKTKTISFLFNVETKNSFIKCIDKICKESEKAIKDGYSFIILSDKGVNKKRTALPALLATGAVHQYLVKKSLRTKIGIILESAEPHEVHHFALLFGYGIDAVNPYFVYQVIKNLVDEKDLNLSIEKAITNYVKAVEKGILKILSKMGISTLQSYRGAQIFEALGISSSVIDRCFTGTVSRIEGADFKIIEKETLMRHAKAFSQKNTDFSCLASGGIYQWKKDGEFHLWNPDSIAALQDATRKGDYSKYKEFAKLINEQDANPTTLRGLLKFNINPSKSININDVEPVEEIVKRFATGAMSFGSISRGAHETIAIAMNRLKAKSNTGEGGEDPARFVPYANGDLARSAIKQIASGRFGVTTNYLVNADEIQIKIAQGAKPGEGGQLPGHKVSVVIAKTRYTTPGVTLISPPPHHDIYSIEDLAQLIFDLKNTNPKARISVKLVSEMGVGTIAAGVAKGHADMILISGGDGGTGASPRSSIRHAGLPWELGLAETHQTLVLNNLRSRVRLQTDGQMRTGKDVAVASILGAEEFGFCTSTLIVLGCVMLRHCHLNNCSVGVATQDSFLEGRFNGKPEHIINYFTFVAQELREIMAELGIKKINDMIGRTELLKLDRAITPWKAKKIDYSKILYKPKRSKGTEVYYSHDKNYEISDVLDKNLIEYAMPALKEKKNVKKDIAIENINRTTGAMLSGEVCRIFGEEGLPEDTIHFKFNGVAGQSFGAWLSRGITFELEGLANDYVGKGISGGKIIIYPDKNCGYKASENIIIGNTTFYGAIKGEAYIRGVAGERFCIRNSGLLAVVEGIGDHGCEYMTGGRVVIIGDTGRNFAAGMSGGIAYVYGNIENFKEKCNLSMVNLESLDEEDAQTVKNLLCNHYKYTNSDRAKFILDDFAEEIKKFIKVMPLEYKRVLANKNIEKKEKLFEPSDG